MEWVGQGRRVRVEQVSLSARIDISLAKLKAQRGEVSPAANENIDLVLKLASKNQNEKALYDLSLAQQVAR